MHLMLTLGIKKIQTKNRICEYNIISHMCKTFLFEILRWTTILSGEKWFPSRKSWLDFKAVRLIKHLLLGQSVKGLAFQGNPIWSFMRHIFITTLWEMEVDYAFRTRIIFRALKGVFKNDY